MALIEVSLPEDVQQALENFPGDKQKFIVKAVQQKLKEARLESLKDELIEGYKNSKAENETISRDFKHVDLEHWDEY